MSGQNLEPIPSVSERLCALLMRAVAPADRARARLHLLDWVGAAVAGAREDALSPIRRMVAGEGSGPCVVLGLVQRVGPQAAALANGPAGAILEMDDVDKRALLHPGPVVIPAALAAAEAKVGVSGVDLLDAIVVGYEAMIRVGRATGEHYRMFHATGTCGTFGAAAAAGRIMGLDRRQMVDALGNAGQQASGLWQVRHEPVFTKALHDGRAAANGLAAAILAREGFAGPRQIMEGPQGFFAAMCPGGDPRRVVADDQSIWAIHEVSFKPHAACRHAHAAIDAALELRDRLGGRTIAQVAVGTYADALAFCHHAEPNTAAEAKFSLAHVVAVALLHGDAGLARFTPAAAADPAIVALRHKVVVAEAADCTARYPARFGAHVRVATADGDSLAASIDDALGDPENPLDAAAVEAKARAMMEWAQVDRATAGAIVDACAAMGEGADPADLGALLGWAS